MGKRFTHHLTIGKEEAKNTACQVLGLDPDKTDINEHPRAMDIYDALRGNHEMHLDFIEATGTVSFRGFSFEHDEGAIRKLKVVKPIEWP